MSSHVQLLTSALDLDPAWDTWIGDYPFLQRAFLATLEETGCAHRQTGWQPQFLQYFRDGQLCGGLPLYLKTHSYGEYVFDWAWAEAHHRHGLRYFPKLVSAVPFTPAPGPRLFGDPVAQQALADAALQLAADLGVSSMHILFPADAELPAWKQRLLRRDGVQFHWQRRGQTSFDEFLAGLHRDKRKKIRQERRKVADAGVTFRLLDGHTARPADWDYFHACYTATYHAHGSSPYLTDRFFTELARRMPETLLLLIAERAGRPIAAALDVRGGQVLYGRYWGSSEYVSGLHFEACYYQGIDYCLQQGLDCFEGGAQGEHKLARGFDPVATHSLHWLAHPAFNDAVADFLQREGAGVADYVDELRERSALRNATHPSAGDPLPG